MLVTVLMAWAPHVAGEDWPEFRGATGQGHSNESGLPVRFSDSENVLWKTAVPGRGWSSPVVADGRVWLTTALNERTRDAPSEGASLSAVAFDLESGREIVRTSIFEIGDSKSPNPKNSLASPTPIVEGDRVYVHFGAEGTAALNSAGEVLWRRRFDYRTQHGNGGSPVLYRDLLIFSCDGFDRAFVVALDKNNGEVRWQTERRRPISQAYSTPLAIRTDGKDQIISVGAFRAASYDPKSGEEIWHVSYGEGFSNVPRPVFGHGLVYIATGFQVPSLMAVRANGAGDVTDTHVAWTLRRGAPLTPSPLLVGEQLFMVNDMGIATAVDAKTGELHWQERLGGNYSASPVYADGRIYFQSEEGVTTVVAAKKQFERLATNRLDGATLASMAVSDASLLIRTDSHLYRFALAN